VIPAACQVEHCFAETGFCGLIAAADGATCDDGDSCTVTDACDDGACVGSGELDCDDGELCTDDRCEAGRGCVNDPNTAPCDDGNLCTANDACYLGVCQGDFISCDDNNPCTDDSCDPLVGCV